MHAGWIAGESHLDSSHIDPGHDVPTGATCDGLSQMQGGTNSGNVVSCAAAVATTDVMMQTDLLSNVTARSEQISTGLRAMAADEKNGGWMIAEVRGIGVGQESQGQRVLN